MTVCANDTQSVGGTGITVRQIMIIILLITF